MGNMFHIGNKDISATYDAWPRELHKKQYQQSFAKEVMPLVPAISLIEGSLLLFFLQELFEDFFLGGGFLEDYSDDILL